MLYESYVYIRLSLSETLFDHNITEINDIERLL